jgi:branched-subunit amino acid transport protein AzlD
VPDPRYTAGVLAVCVGITVTLRAVPFIARGALKDLPAATALGRWLPFGAVSILAAYCLTRIDLGSVATAAGPLAGLLVTVGVHLWRRNLVLSIVFGTLVCVLMTNWLPD